MSDDASERIQSKLDSELNEIIHSKYSPAVDREGKPYLTLAMHEEESLNTREWAYYRVGVAEGLAFALHCLEDE
ncbi:hypothetical protein ACOZ4F_20005 [Haloarcula marismortui]|uniref:hypothetical protein n=1 Tax=Haloarcula marismortui TaxID=2238 RepID=UPI003C7312BF